MTSKSLAILAGPLLGLITGWAMVVSGWDNAGAWAGGITVWCAIWWIFEPIPIPITSLLPMALFPMSGVLTGSQIAASYGHPLIILLMGGAMLSKSMEKTGTHKRLALSMVNAMGGSNPRRVVLGFMVTSAALSMWISNTATTLMLLPIAMAIVSNSGNQSIKVPLLLGIAYAASIGGLATPIGTPPNLIFLSVYQTTTGASASFSQWMLWAMPVVVLFIPICWWWLTRNIEPGTVGNLEQVGQWRKAEVRVLVVFTLTAIAWMTLEEPFGGWTGWFDLPNANYAAVALIAVIALSVIPDGEGDRLLDWHSASSIHWGVLLLFSGGLCIAAAFQETGISLALAKQLGGLSNLPTFVIIAVVALSVTFLTEITSNTATATVLMPVLAATAVGAGIDPILLMFPAVLSASCAFMLPVATAPNAIVFGTGELTVKRMAREGLMLNLIGAALISVISYGLFSA